MEGKLVEETYKRNQGSEMSSKPKEGFLRRSGQYLRDLNKLTDVIVFKKQERFGDITVKVSSIEQKLSYV